ncbi:MAG: hypothetical protein ACI35O_07550 [Bacillaceae bacterium]
MDTTQIYKYTIVKAKCNHTGEYIALVPVFHNGFEYTRAYGFTEIDYTKI